MTFADLRLSEPILRALTHEGYSIPTPIQAQAIPHVLDGHDVLGCAQTGTGKTAAFALPILDKLGREHMPHPNGARHRKIRCLVLSPTRELASQIDESFRTYGKQVRLRHAVVFGGVGMGNQIRTLQDGVDILVATPGRLLDLMNQGYVDLSGVEIFVLDEADRMLDMGFIHDIRRVVPELPPKRQNLMFSATMPADIRQLANTILRQPQVVHVAPVAATAALVKEYAYQVKKADKASLLLNYINSNGITRMLVFTRTKHGADRVAKHLSRGGIRAEAIHGNKAQNARQRALANFKSDRPPILVATDIATRGIDVDDVSHVINFDVPNVAETYVHRIGRTGRAGAEGVAVSFVDGEERSYLRDIERLTRKTIEVRTDQPNVAPRPPEHRSEAHASPNGDRSRQHKPGRSLPPKPRTEGSMRDRAAPGGGAGKNGSPRNLTATAAGPSSHPRRSHPLAGGQSFFRGRGKPQSKRGGFQASGSGRRRP